MSNLNKGDKKMTYKFKTLILKLALLVTGILILVQLFWPTNAKLEEITDNLGLVNPDSAQHEEIAAGFKSHETQ